MSTKSDNDNRANQLNENNDVYWQLCGLNRPGFSRHLAS